MDAFSWIGAIFEALLQFVPRLTIVRDTEGGVIFHRGKYPKVVRPGIKLWLPLISELEIIPVRRQSANLEEQTIATANGKVMAVGGLLVYEVSDVLKFLTQSADTEDTIRDLALGIISNAMEGHDQEWLLANKSKFRREVVLEIRKSLKYYGVRVFDVYFTDFFPVRHTLATWSPGGRWSGGLTEEE